MGPTPLTSRVHPILWKRSQFMLASGETARLAAIVVVTILGLALAGVLGARAAGTTLLRPTLRVVLGMAAMLVTALIGRLAGVAGL